MAQSQSGDDEHGSIKNKRMGAAFCRAHGIIEEPLLLLSRGRLRGACERAAEEHDVDGPARPHRLLEHDAELAIIVHERRQRLANIRVLRDDLKR